MKHPSSQPLQNLSALTTEQMTQKANNLLQISVEWGGYPQPKTPKFSIPVSTYIGFAEWELWATMSGEEMSREESKSEVVITKRTEWDSSNYQSFTIWQDRLQQVFPELLATLQDERDTLIQKHLDDVKKSLQPIAWKEGLFQATFTISEKHNSYTELFFKALQQHPDYDAIKVLKFHYYIDNGMDQMWSMAGEWTDYYIKQHGELNRLDSSHMMDMILKTAE